MKSMIHSHVDDLMFAGREDCGVHIGLMEKLKTKFNWGAAGRTQNSFSVESMSNRTQTSQSSCRKPKTLMGSKKFLFPEIGQG